MKIIISAILLFMTSCTTLSVNMVKNQGSSESEIKEKVALPESKLKANSVKIDQKIVN